MFSDTRPDPSTGLKSVMTFVFPDIGVFHMIDPDNMPEPLRTYLASCTEILNRSSPVSRKEAMQTWEKMMAGEDISQFTFSKEVGECLSFFCPKLEQVMLSKEWGIDGLVPQAYGFVPMPASLEEEGMKDKLIGFVMGAMYGKAPAYYFTRFAWDGDNPDFLHPSRIFFSQPQLAPRRFLGEYQATWEDIVRPIPALASHQSSSEA